MVINSVWVMCLPLDRLTMTEWRRMAGVAIRSWCFLSTLKAALDAVVTQEKSWLQESES